jgi:hypothetical protein
VRREEPLREGRKVPRQSVNAPRSVGRTVLLMREHTSDYITSTLLLFLDLPSPFLDLVQQPLPHGLSATLELVLDLLPLELVQTMGRLESDEVTDGQAFIVSSELSGRQRRCCLWGPSGVLTCTASACRCSPK